MRREHYDLTVADEIATGTAFDCKSFTHITIVVHPGMSGTTPLSELQLMVSNDNGTSFIAYATAVTTDTLYKLDHEAYTHVRVDTTDYVSGTPTATFCGDNQRTS